MSFEIMYADQGLAQNERQPVGDGNAAQIGNLVEAERKFMHFLQETQEQNKFIYRLVVTTSRISRSAATSPEKGA